ncbi:MAG: TetR/AcrR family transcriptional regulator [Chloroflexota bacterium]
MSQKQLNRAQRRKLETRQKILNAAASLLTQRGYPDLTVRAITEEADIGYGTFYLHFSDKDDVVWELISVILEQTDTVINEQVSNLDFPQKEYARLLIFFDLVGKNKIQFLTVLGKNSSPTLAYRYRETVAKLTTQNFKENNYQNRFVDVPLEVMANFYSGAMLRLVVWWLETESQYTSEQMAQMVFKMAFPTQELPF